MKNDDFHTAQQLWSWVATFASHQPLISSLEALWHGCQTLQRQNARSHILVGAVLWVICGERNRAIFNTDAIPKSARSLATLVRSHFIVDR
jgi:hypothetical protein